MHRLGGLLAKLRKESIQPSDASGVHPNPPFSVEEHNGNDSDSRHPELTPTEDQNLPHKATLKQIRHQQRRNRQRLKKRLVHDDTSSLSSEESHDTGIKADSDIQDAFEIPSPSFGELQASLWFKVTKDNQNENDFLKSAKWSPTGDRIITCSEENGTLRCYHCPGQRTIEPDLELCDSSSTTICSPECVYDFCWYPYSSMEIENSSLLAVSARSRPIQLWDVCNSTLRASYRSYDHVGMVSTPHSIAFSLDGSKIIGGFDSCLRIFPVDCPGTVYTEYWTKLSKRSRQQSSFEEVINTSSTGGFMENAVSDYDYNMSGIISSLAISPTMPGVMSCGTFSGEISIFDESTMKPVAQLGRLEGEKYKLLGLEKARHAGVTQLKFTPQGQLLVGFRNFDQIHCYDLRNPYTPIWTVPRSSNNAQRIGFDIDSTGSLLMTGSRDGLLKTWNITSSPEPTPLNSPNIPTYPSDTISHAQFHPYLTYFCFTTGQRRLPSFEGDSSESDDDHTPQRSSPDDTYHHSTPPSSTKHQNHLVVGYWANSHSS